MNKYDIIPFRNGYVIGKADESGRLICKVSRIYYDRHRAERDLEDKSFDISSCGKTCNKCVYSLGIEDYIELSDSTLEIVHIYLYMTNYNPSSELYKYLRKNSTDVVVDVYYNVKDNKIVEFNVHDGNMGSIDYKFTEAEKQKIADKIFHYLNAKDVIIKLKNKTYKEKRIPNQEYLDNLFKRP